ncbi:hypothetical protein BRAS3809_7990039 [Bradyrhizobium sp. STM 3809]|nr:hypothetical protein BRAS3809_7990039 [Bradyrhizobium sp. STM 3809]
MRSMHHSDAEGAARINQSCLDSQLGNLGVITRGRVIRYAAAVMIDRAGGGRLDRPSARAMTAGAIVTVGVR